MADGSRHSLYVVPESSWGVTPGTPAFDLVRTTGTTLGLSRDSLQSEEIRSDRQISDFRGGANQVGGDINFELSYGSFDQLLEAVLMGTWTTDQPVAGTDQVKAGTTRRSFTFMRHFADLPGGSNPYYLYTGVEINNLQLQISANAMITGTMSVVGKGQETASAEPAGSTYNPESTTSPLDSFSGELKENGNTIAVITEIQLNLENGLEPRYVVGSKDSITPSSGRSNCSGTITAYFEDSTLVDKFLNETESSIEFTLPDGAGNELKVILPRIKYTGGQPDVSGEGPITLSMPFQALLDATESTNIIFERTPV